MDPTAPGLGAIGSAALGLVASAGVMRADAAALDALVAQARRLQAVAAGVEEALARLPAGAADGEWRGPASSAFDAALGMLRGLVASAASSVDEALVETRRAVSTMGGW